MIVTTKTTFKHCTQQQEQQNSQALVAVMVTLREKLKTTETGLFQTGLSEQSA